MKRLTIALAVGLVFGAGLVLSGMTDPGRVIAFLDITGRWNPALALVMGGAVATAFPFFLYARRHQRTLDGETVRLPGRFRIDARLVLGAALFGLGWGLIGVCPGPAVVLFGEAPLRAATILVAMAAGGLAFSPSRSA
jgi:uncharacterized membrane protein YedE/YeeE